MNESISLEKTGNCAQMEVMEQRPINKRFHTRLLRVAILVFQIHVRPDSEPKSSSRVVFCVSSCHATVIGGHAVPMSCGSVHCLHVMHKSSGDADLSSSDWSKFAEVKMVAHILALLRRGA